MVGVSESGGFGGGNGCSNGVLCEGCIEVVVGIRGVLGVFGVLDVDVRGGGMKNDGFIRVVWIVGVLLDVFRGNDVVKEVIGRVVVVGEIIDGMGIGVRVEEVDMIVWDCIEWVVGGWDVVVGMVLGVLMCIVFCCVCL